MTRPTLKEESNAKETFARTQIREIRELTFANRRFCNFSARINFRDLAETEKLSAVIQCFYQRKSIRGAKKWELTFTN